MLNITKYKSKMSCCILSDFYELVSSDLGQPSCWDRNHMVSFCNSLVPDIGVTYCLMIVLFVPKLSAQQEHWVGWRKELNFLMKYYFFFLIILSHWNVFNTYLNTGRQGFVYSTQLSRVSYTVSTKAADDPVTQGAWHPQAWYWLCFKDRPSVLLTHCSLEMPYGDMNLGQHWLR